MEALFLKGNDLSRFDKNNRSIVVNQRVGSPQQQSLEYESH